MVATFLFGSMTCSPRAVCSASLLTRAIYLAVSVWSADSLVSSRFRGAGRNSTWMTRAEVLGLSM